MIAAVAATAMPASASKGETSRLKRIIAMTGSMLPTVPIDSVLTVDTEFYRDHAVERFDIVAFHRTNSDYPGGQNVSGQFVARVIGLPRDVVALRENVVVLNHRPLREPMQTLPCADAVDVMPCASVKAVTVPDGEYYLLADNRGESEDSRIWIPSTIPASDFVGKVVGFAPPPCAHADA